MGMGNVGGGGKFIPQTKLEAIIFVPIFFIFGMIGLIGILTVIGIVCFFLYFLINILLIIF